MIIDCISDLHGYYPDLEGGDLLIIAGDLTARDIYSEYGKFYTWLDSQKYEKKIFIGGNHDNILQCDPPSKESTHLNFEYLCDSETEFEGLKIWGSPWTLNFQGQNPKCKAFGVDCEEELQKKWDLIPEDVDIFITHSPPYEILDTTVRGEHVGCKSLSHKVQTMINPPKLWVWGHIHESYGIDLSLTQMHCPMINACHVNEKYKPVNKPIRVIL